MDILIPFLIGFLAQFVMICSAVRLDKYVRPTGFWKFISLGEKQKRFFIFSQRKARTDFLKASILMQVISYSFLVVTTLLFVVATFVKTDLMDWISIIFSFVIGGIALISNLVEVVVLFKYKE